MLKINLKNKSVKEYAYLLTDGSGVSEILAVSNDKFLVLERDGTGLGEFVELGRVDGHLTTAPQGERGFGYDPIFVPSGMDRTAAQLTAEEKNAISHRGIAFRALAPRIIEVLAGN